MTVRIPHPGGIHVNRIDTPELVADGNAVYVTDPAAGEVAEVAQSGRVQVHTYGAKVQPIGLTVATDGSVWFGDAASGRFGRLTAGGRTTFFSPRFIAGGQGGSLVPGAQGSMWVISSFESAHVSADGSIRTIRLSAFSGFVQDAVSDPAGDAWVLTGGERGLGEIAPTQVGRISPGGKVLDVPLGSIEPTLLAVGPGGAVYFSGTDSATHENVLGTISAAGVISSTPVGFTVTDMFTARDGSLWLSTSVGLASVSNGLQARVVGGAGVPSSASEAADGTFWYSTGEDAQLGRVTQQGVFSKYTVPANPDSPVLTGVAADQLGNVWAVSGGELVGNHGVVVTRVDLNHALLASGVGTALEAGPVQQGATVTNFSHAASARDLMATVTWPDGTMTSADIVATNDPGEFGVSAAAGHAMGDGTGTVRVRDSIDGRTASTTFRTVGNLPVTVGTPINITVTAGVPFTLPIADFTHVVPEAKSMYAPGVGWGVSDSHPFGVGAGLNDPVLQSDGHGGLYEVATHVFFSPGTFPVTVNLGSFRRGVNIDIGNTVMAVVTVVPDTDPNHVLLNASLTPLPAPPLHTIPYAMAGTADLDALLGVKAGAMDFTGRFAYPERGGIDVGLTFQSGKSRLNLRLLTARNAVPNDFVSGPCRVVAASGVFAGIKPKLTFTLLMGTSDANEYILLSK